MKKRNYKDIRKFVGVLSKKEADEIKKDIIRKRKAGSRRITF